MKNLMKHVIVMFAALSFSFANAGDLSITGAAKASYSVAGSDGAGAGIQQGKGLGVANEFTLSATGELDNGYTWSYAQDIDGATAQDDGKLTLTMGGFGTVGVFISEGGLDTDNTASQSVLSRPSDTSYNEAMVDTYDLSGANTLQYHTPADILPFGITAKVAYAPSSSSAGSLNSHSATGAENIGSFTAASTSFNTTAAPIGQTSAMGRTATHYQVKANPIDGLNLGVDYVDFDTVSGATEQTPESGSYYATYAYGPATIGYSRSYLATAIGGITADVLESIEAKKYSIGVNVNDDFSVSYEHEESDPNNVTSGSTGFVKMESTGIQAAYTMGGMTVAVAMNDHENAQYTDTKDIKDTVVSVAMAF
jgi:hypothetical protein